MAGVLERAFPQLRGRIDGGNAPIPAYKQALATLASTSQYALLALFLMGDRLLGWVGIQQPPAWLKALLENKMYGIAAYFGLNMVATNLVSTGAFEVYLVGAKGATKLVYSAIASNGAVPNPEYLIHLLINEGLVNTPDL
jgi:hypothetical protein